MVFAMNLDTTTVIAVAAPMITALAWLFRMEGRINLLDQRYIDIKADLEEIKQDVKVIRNGHK
jgi:hypothetical protein